MATDAREETEVPRGWATSIPPEMLSGINPYEFSVKGLIFGELNDRYDNEYTRVTRPPLPPLIPTYPTTPYI